MISDIMRSHYDSDISLFQGGTIRANIKYEAGLLSWRFVT